jgi:hypothetical protein
VEAVSTPVHVRPRTGFLRALASKAVDIDDDSSEVHEHEEDKEAADVRQYAAAVAPAAAAETGGCAGSSAGASPCLRMVAVGCAYLVCPSFDCV